MAVSELAQLLSGASALRILRPNTHDVKSNIRERLLLSDLGGGENFVRRHVVRREMGRMQCGEVLKTDGGDDSCLYTLLCPHSLADLSPNFKTFLSR